MISQRCLFLQAQIAAAIADTRRLTPASTTALTVDTASTPTNTAVAVSTIIPELKTPVIDTVVSGVYTPPP